MSQEERTTAVGLCLTVIVNIYIALRLRDMWTDGAFDGADALMIWARTILWMIGIALALHILALIVTSVVVAILRGEREPMMTDERDRAFQIRGNLVTMVVASVGFLGAVVALAVGWSALAAFTLTYFAFAVGNFAGDLVKLMSYRVGG